MSEREFWLVVRSALIMVSNAIERRYLKGGNGSNGNGVALVRAQSATPIPAPQSATGTPAPTFGQPSPG